MEACMEVMEAWSANPRSKCKSNARARSGIARRRGGHRGRMRQRIGARARHPTRDPPPRAERICMG